MVSPSTCFTIRTQDLVLDCQTHTVIYGDTTNGWGVNITTSNAYENITIKNCDIKKRKSDGTIENYGFYLDKTKDVLIVNNSVLTGGSRNNRAFFLSSALRTNITQNLIMPNGSTNNNVGIYAQSLSNDTYVTNNDIITGGITGNSGAYAFQCNNFVYSDNNILVNTTGSNNHGILNFWSSLLMERNNVTNYGVNNNDGVYSFTTTGNQVIIKDNTLNTYNGSTSNGLQIVFGNVNVSNNTLNSVEGYDLNLGSGLVNTYLVNQPVWDYQIFGTTHFGVVNDYGIIEFIDGVTAHTGSNFSAQIVIGNNSAFVNSTNSNFNKSANITFYDMSSWGLANPQILRNGITCDSTTNPSCYALTDLTLNIVSFNVSAWSTYTLGEILTQFLV